MLTVKVLKRKDASSVLVAVVVALIVNAFLNSVVADLASRFSGNGTIAGSWKVQYLQPFMMAALALIALELLIWIYTWVHSMISSSK